MSPPRALRLLNRLEALAGVKLPHVERIATGIETVELPGGACAFREGQSQPHLFVVRSGLLKQYYTDVDGAEWIKSFTGEGDVFACVEALARGGVTSFASEAIEDSVVERVQYSVIEALCAAHSEWQRAVSAAYAFLAKLKIRRERDLLMLSAEQLYAQFVAASPGLAERIPQKDLAGFIGVTAVGLNRIVRRHRSR